MNINESLITAICNEKTDVVRSLLTQGANPNHALDSADVKPLHFAAQTGNHAITQLLLEHGAERSAKTNPDGQSAADIATLHKHEHLLALLQTA